MRILLVVFIVLISLSASADESIDLSTPEATLSGYLICLEEADVDCVLRRYHGIDNFTINKAHKTDYKIVKKIECGTKEVEDWNSKGIIPASRIGDVELQVEEEFSGYKGMYSYNFRNIGGQWFIISHSAWGVD